VVANIDFAAIDVGVRLGAIGVTTIVHPLQEMALSGGRFEHPIGVLVVQFLPDSRSEIKRRGVELKQVPRTALLRVHRLSP
jgi:hypothetical protein